VSARLLQHMARRLALKSRGVRGTTAADVPARVARGLLTLADKYAVDAVVRHGLTQQQLAEVVGASREKVNKALKDFADQRWVELARGCFVLLDEPALRRRAGMPQHTLAVR
jgi:CRP/FNR family cyclic AMP-dependent transcriptional regulator